MPYHQIMRVTMSCAIGLCAMPPCTWLFCEHGTPNQNGLLHIHASDLTHFVTHLFHSWVWTFPFSSIDGFWTWKMDDFFLGYQHKCREKGCHRPILEAFFLPLNEPLESSLIWQFPPVHDNSGAKNHQPAHPIFPSQISKKNRQLLTNHDHRKSYAKVKVPNISVTSNGRLNRITWPLMNCDHLLSFNDIAIILDFLAQQKAGHDGNQWHSQAKKRVAMGGQCNHEDYPPQN